MRLKNLSVFALSATAALVLVSTGCKKSNDSASGFSLSATIGASAWAATATPGQYAGVYERDNLLFDVAGMRRTSQDTSTLYLILPLVAKPGMTVSSDTSVLTITYSPNFARSIYMAQYGFGGHALVTMTTQDTVNHKIAGTFSGTVYNLANASDSLVITNGKFSTTYVVQ
jgi:hypothetical protein